MKSLVLLLDAAAPSFCYYPSPKPSTSRTMSAEVFERALGYARRNDLPLQLICGDSGLPDDLEAIVGGHPAVCYAPARACKRPSDVPVIDASDLEAIQVLPVGRHDIAVLRVGNADLDRLPHTWRALAERVHRVVLVLRELDDAFDGAALDAYESALQAMRNDLERAYLEGENAELNVITDRMVLVAPRQCNAGIDHVTVDPEGRLHVCPGFAVDDAFSREPIGELGKPPHVPNGELLDLERAPICSVCDAFQCRRCVYLNRRETLELNTPPMQMCRAAHLEREAARLTLLRLHRNDVLTSFAAIPSIDYDDPLELLLGSAGEDRDRGIRGRPLPSRSAKVTPKTIVAGPQPLGPDAVGRVSEEERDAIRQLHLRRRGLTELFSSLAKMDDATLEATPLYRRIVQDMGAVTTEFQDWWDRMARKYAWVQVDGRPWTIDFATCEIRLQSEPSMKGGMQ